jgi:dTDP-4-dehydrorhamnose 3,5-epimerase
MLAGVQCPGRDELDITDPRSVDAFDWRGVEVIVNAAAYTDVDRAEQAGRQAAWSCNADGAARLAAVATRLDALLVHFSSDYVYPGHGTEPVREDAVVAPLNQYGLSKAHGDTAVSAHRRHIVLRTAWVVGEGRNFIRTMLELARGGASPIVVADQVGRLTFAQDLAAAAIHLIRERAATGVYHITGSGEPVSWAEVARRVFRAAGRSPSEIGERRTEEFCAEFPDKARRPLNSVLDLRKAQEAGVATPDWTARLDAYLGQVV